MTSILLNQPFFHWHQSYCPSAYIVAVSGGRDSMALMHAIARMQAQLSIPIEVVYVNHHWQTQAQQWGQWVVQQAQALALPAYQLSADYHLLNTNQGPEGNARQARYQALKHYIDQRDYPRPVLLTAHHQDDQAETLLLQLLRGSGLAGLAAMPSRSAFAGGEHWRPLLTHSRQTINTYIATHHIEYLEDPSNSHTRYQRNWLRHHIMPKLNARQPSATQAIARSAQWLGEALALETELLAPYFDPQRADRLALTPMLNASELVQKAVLRQWLRRLELQALPHKRLHEWLIQIRQGNGNPSWQHGAYHIIYRQFNRTPYLQLYHHTTPSNPPIVKAQTHWQGIGEIDIYSGWQRLSAYCSAQQLTPIWALYPLTPSPRFQPQHVQHSHSLKEWFRRYEIPPYIRRRTPILLLIPNAQTTAPMQIVWAGGLGVSAQFAWLGINWQKKAHSVSIPPSLQSVFNHHD